MQSPHITIMLENYRMGATWYSVAVANRLISRYELSNHSVVRYVGIEVSMTSYRKTAVAEG